MLTHKAKKKKHTFLSLLLLHRRDLNSHVRETSELLLHEEKIGIERQS